MGFSFEMGDIPALISVALMILGFRLLGIARRNSSAPEFLIGLYLIFSPPATSLLMRIDRFDPQYQPMLQIVVGIGMAVASVCLAAFAWRVFRPNEPWARVLTGLVACYFVGGIVLGVVDSAGEYRDTYGAITRFVLVGIYLWLWIECHRHRKILEKRMKIGLTDPVVVNRFLLFEIWFGVLALLPGLVILFAAFLTSSGASTSGPVFALVVRIAGVFIYATMWLSFLPPAGYRRWLKRRHQEAFPDTTPSAMEA